MAAVIENAPHRRTCCPHDPECDHSFITDVELRRHLSTPITDEEAEELT